MILQYVVWADKIEYHEAEVQHVILRVQAVADNCFLEFVLLNAGVGICFVFRFG